jgi:hypothetical protein
MSFSTFKSSTKKINPKRRARKVTKRMIKLLSKVKRKNQMLQSRSVVNISSQSKSEGTPPPTFKSSSCLLS